MHFEILVEDASGKQLLEILVPKILKGAHTFKVRFYKGIGRLPKGLTPGSEPCKRILLDQLPRLLQGFGQTFAAYPTSYEAVVFVICDLDDRCLKTFRSELLAVLDKCNPAPTTRFCIAIEEGEAWLLGDLAAVRRAFPHAKGSVLSDYVSDAICGTWERLADAVCSGGAEKLRTSGWMSVGKEKSAWASLIGPQMDVHANNSPSFCYFRNKLQELAEASTASI